MDFIVPKMRIMIIFGTNASFLHRFFVSLQYQT